MSPRLFISILLSASLLGAFSLPAQAQILPQLPGGSVIPQLPVELPTVLPGASDPNNDPCASQCLVMPDQNANSTDTDMIKRREACDQCRAKQDQENLKKIRETEDGPLVQQMYDACRSEYASASNGTMPAASGQFVPVHETGQLLSLAQNSSEMLTSIEGFSGKSYDVNILLCMYLHAIKRVQYAMEDLTFIKEPDMRRQAATKIEEYKQGLLGPKGLIKTGYSPSGIQAETGAKRTEGGAPLYPKNLGGYLDDASLEGETVVEEDLKNSLNVFRDEVGTQLAREKTEYPPALSSTITKEDYDKFIYGDVEWTASGWAQTFNNIFSIDSPNNPFTAYMLVKQRQEMEANRRRDIALSEYDAGGGYLPVRKCVRMVGNVCRDWENTTPGSTVREITGDAMNARLQEYINPNVGQIGNGNEPTTNETQTFEPSYAGGGADTGGQTDNRYNINFNINVNGGGGDGGDGGNGGGGGSNVDRPLMVFIDAANHSALGTKMISWGTANAAFCQTNNDWIGAGTAGLVGTIKRKGEVVSGSGDLEFKIPLKFDAYWSRGSGSSTKDNMTIATSTLGTSQKITWTVPAPKSSTDSFTLVLRDADNIPYAITIDGARDAFDKKTALELVTRFGQHATANPNLPVYKKYKFSYNTKGKPSISLELREPVYELKCRGVDGSTKTASSD